VAAGEVPDKATFRYDVGRGRSVIGTASNLILQRSGWRLWVALALVVGGTTLLCIRAFRIALDVSWSVYIKSRTFIAGVLLVIVGQVIGWGSGNDPGFVRALG
jgi:hypothetical protein